MQFTDILLYIFVIGGAALLLLVMVVWVTKSMLTQEMERHLSLFKMKIRAETDVALESFKNGVQSQMAVRENKANNVAKLYAHLIDVLKAGKGFASINQDGSQRNRVEKGKAVADAVREFFDYYQKQSLYFSDDLCKAMDKFIAKHEPTVELLEVADAQASRDNEEINMQMLLGWQKLEDQVQPLMKKMKGEFRNSQTATQLWSESGDSPSNGGAPVSHADPDPQDTGPALL